MVAQLVGGEHETTCQKMQDTSKKNVVIQCVSGVARNRLEVMCSCWDACVTGGGLDRAAVPDKTQRDMLQQAC